MTPRFLGLGLLAVMLLFAGFMASVGLLVREPLPILAPHQSLDLRSAELAPPITVTVAIDGRYQVTVTLDHAGHAAPPQTVLVPSGAGPIDMEWQSLGEGRLEGTGQMTRPGRWQVVLQTGQQAETLPFVVRE